MVIWPLKNLFLVVALKAATTRNLPTTLGPLELEKQGRYLPTQDGPDLVDKANRAESPAPHLSVLVKGPLTTRLVGPVPGYLVLLPLIVLVMLVPIVPMLVPIVPPIVLLMLVP